MTGGSWIGFLSGVALAAFVAVIARFAFRGGGLWRQTACRFACPLRGDAVNCRIFQNIRTGQWMSVQACSAFPELPGAVPCGEECRKLANVGLLVPLTLSTAEAERAGA